MAFPHALRSLARSPAASAAAALSLAIGIGATTAAFSVWDAVLLRSITARDPSALVLLTTRNAGSIRGLSHPGFLYLRDHASTLEGLAAFRTTPLNVTVGTQTDRVTGMLVSGNYFDVLGVGMRLGSGIVADDDRVPGIGGPRGVVVVLSHEFWRQRFGEQPAVIGRAIRINGRAATIVGVAPPRFTGTAVGSMPSVYVPMMFASHIFDGPWLENPRNLWLRAIGRLRPGVTVQQADADLTSALRRFHQDIVVPIANTDAARRRAREAAVVLESGRAGLLELGQTVRPTMTALLGLAALVMLTACINVASLLVARAERLHKNTAIARALGASQSRVWGARLAESLAIAAAGTALGLLFAFWIRDVLARLVAVNGTLDIRMDARVLSVAALSGLMAAMVIGSIVGWQQTRVDIIRALKGEDLMARMWLRRGLIVAQLAFAVVVLVTAAVLGRTLIAMRAVDLGFSRDKVVVASIAPAGYAPQQRRDLYSRLLDEIRRVPGVVSAAVAGNEPLDVNTGWNMTVPADASGTPRSIGASIAFVSDGYFATMGIPLVRGRDFTSRDIGSAAQPVIVNENFVRTYLAGVDPIGFRVTGNGTMIFEIVGVVRDSAAFSLRDLDQHMVYVPSAEGVFHIRTTIAPSAIQAMVTDAVRRTGSDVPVFNVRTIGEVIDRFLVRERTLALLSWTFGGLALVMAAVGVYGVLANAVTRRTRELGIRIALGADGDRIIRSILRDAARLVVIGIVAALPLMMATGRAIRSVLFGVEPLDAMSLLLSIALLSAIAGVAAWIPARRAARVDPMVVLRCD